LTEQQEIEAFLSLIMEEWRSSPSGYAWHQFWRRLDESKPAGAPKPPVPLILAASDESDAKKHLRLKSQLEWAAKHGLARPALSWLRAVPANQWNQSSPEMWDKDSYPDF